MEKNETCSRCGNPNSIFKICPAGSVGEPCVNSPDESEYNQKHKTDWKVYLEKNGLPDTLVLTPFNDSLLIGEPVDKQGTMIRNVLKSCEAYREYGKAAAKMVVEQFYDNQVMKMYIAKVNAQLATGARTYITSYEAFCGLPVPKEILDKKKRVLENV
jgi:hypothetical protein